MKKPEFKKPNIKLNINYEFTKREKGLLYILGMALLIMAALYLVFFPGINKYQTLSEQRSEAEFKKQEMEMAIASLPANKTIKDAAAADLSAKKEGYEKHMTNDELDNLITNLVVDGGFKAQDLAITANDIATVATFGSDGEQPAESTDTTTEAQEMKDLAEMQGNTTTDENSTTTTAEPTISGIYIGTVTMTIQGNIGQFENLLDTVNGRSDIQITAFDVVPVQVGTYIVAAMNNTLPSLQTGTTLASVTFNVYMVDKGAAAANAEE
ncbi:hypothetical protein [Eubacterium limosum]|uniref:hypothetical protein n=1 Tax=Eubacterium limosum TaxID=1736 RepID=UPI001063DDE5|nr:hypothetical protein [Eubacterium limosum]